jgi:RNA methyltransferase, TrmH family
MKPPEVISSRDNPLIKELRRLVQDGAAYRKSGRIWIEGEHLSEALLARDALTSSLRLTRVQSLGFYEQKWQFARMDTAQSAIKTVVISDALMKEVSSLESPSGCGLLVEGLADQPLDDEAPTVILDRLQDPGNVGSILRSAAAFGYTQILALKGTAALWSLKVLRAGMGAHFSLRLVEAASLDEVKQLARPLAVTSSHRGDYLHQLRIDPIPNWALGHEGQGVSAEIEALAQLQVRIAQPGGQESLNVAAAAAICLHASAAQIHA